MEKIEPEPCALIKARYAMAILSSIIMAIFYGLKVNLHVAIVSMVNHTAIIVPIAVDGLQNRNDSLLNRSASIMIDDKCGRNATMEDAGKHVEDGPFVWSTTVQGAILSAYFWGYIVTQIPGGRLSELYSSTRVLLHAAILNIVGTLATPFAAHYHPYALVAVRIVEGAAAGTTFPAMHVLLSKWAPPGERSQISNIVYSGTALGTVVFMLVSGVMEWEMVFYVQGGVSAVWVGVWAWLAEDTPRKACSKHPWLVRQSEFEEIERELASVVLEAGTNDAGGYSIKNTDSNRSVGGTDVSIGHGINESKNDGTNGASVVGTKVADVVRATGGPGRRLRMPWTAALLSRPFLAILIAHTCNNWGWYVVLIELPVYMKHVLHFAISENALLSALPFFTLWLFSMLLTRLLGALQAHGWIGTVTVHKIATSVSSTVPIVCFITLCFVECNRFVAVVTVTLAITSLGGMYSGYLSNHIDIAPNFAGTLIAITNTVASLPGIVVPIFVGALTKSDPSINSWRKIFYVTIVFYLIELIMYNLWGSAKVQSWNNSYYEEDGKEYDGNDEKTEKQVYNQIVEEEKPLKLEKVNYASTKL